MIEVADTNEALSADAINSTVPCATKKPIAITFSLLAKRGFHCYWVFSLKHRYLRKIYISSLVA